jgi:hypothetical protein
MLAGPCDDLCAVLEPLIRTDRLEGLLLSRPQVAATLGAGHIFLTAAGSRNERFDRLVFGALETGFGETVERLPYRIMDQRWTRNLVRDVPFGFDDLVPISILSSRAHPFYMTEEDAYAVTHAIMYLTDFGAASQPDRAAVDRMATLVDSGLAWHLVSEDFDLLTEFLIDAECLDAPASPYARFAWAVLGAAWQQWGFLPGPTFDVARFSGLSGEEKSAYGFQHLYHTNLVAGILCAVALRAGTRTGASWDGLHGPDDEDTVLVEQVVARTIAIVGARSGTESPWFQTIAELSLGDRAVSSILGDAAVIHAVRRRDLAAAEETLRLLDSKNLVETETRREARWFLERLGYQSGGVRTSAGSRRRPGTGAARRSTRITSPRPPPRRR